MKNNKISIDLNIEDLLGLKENNNTLEYDLNFILENGIDKYLQDLQTKEDKKKEFIELFRECYDDIVKIMEFDPKKRVAAINCFTCIRCMDLSKQYGEQRKSK